MRRSDRHRKVSGPHRRSFKNGEAVIATLVLLRDAGVALPACVWCSSPWVDLENSGTTMTSKADVDPLIQKSYLMELAAAYLNGADPRGPLVSPIHADLYGLPPHVNSGRVRRDATR